MFKIIPDPIKTEYREGAAGTGTRYEKKAGLPSEGYEIEGCENGITVYYGSEAGKFYADVTLRQIKRGCGENIPKFAINDAPRYQYRGYMLDCARHFFPIEVIKLQIDMMAELKLNRFHWHLTDDQGWRIEIKKYPQLTEIGSRRASSRNDGKEVSGFYTQEQIKDIVAYCKERFIEVVPEIDMPGHFTAAIASYNYLGCRNEAIKTAESFGIKADIVCAGKESSYEFCQGVLEEVFSLFPYEYVHLGGDEALKLNWLKCPHCQKAIAENKLSGEEALQGHFMSRMAEFAAKFNKKVINWNDGLYGGNVLDTVVVQYWKESKAGKEVLYKEKDRKVIISPFFAYYMDYPYGMTNLKKTYNYCIDEKIAQNVIGLEAPLWTEYVDNGETAEQMIYPRLAAVAERAWTGENRYKSFLIRLKAHFAYLDASNIRYTADYNPNFVKAAAQVIKFFANANDKTARENLRLQAASRKAVRAKYRNK